MSRYVILGMALCLAASPVVSGQQVIGDMTGADASVKGSVVLASTGTRLLSGSSVNAGSSAASVRLVRGGELRICPHTGVAITTSQSGKDLQIALNTGAVEAHYSLKTSADSVLTPDFRILFPGPGTFHFAIASDTKGNTCVRSLPGNASSLVVTEVLGDGIYQVQPTDQVYFRGGRVANADAFVPPDCGCGAPQPPVMRAETEQPAVPTQPTRPVTNAPAPATTQTQVAQGSAPPQPVQPRATGPAFVTEAPAPKPQPPAQQQPKPAPKVDVGAAPPTSPQAVIATYGKPVGEAPQSQPVPPPPATSANLQADVPLVFSAESVVPPPPMTLALQSMAPLNLNEAALLPTPGAPPTPVPAATGTAANQTATQAQPKKNKGVFGKIGGFFSTVFGGGKKK